MKQLQKNIKNRIAFPLTPNIAICGKATQSSLHSNGIAYNSIDGNRAGYWSKGSCSHTAQELNPWWRLDLGKTHKVFSVNVTSNVENYVRLRGAEIRIEILILQRNIFSASSHFCNGMDGRYINIVIPARVEVLTLCEVEVYGYRAPTGENIAICGKATQSSLHSNGIAYNSIDGNRAGYWSKGSCSHTAQELNPWWRLDLGKTHKVFSVNVTSNVENYVRLRGAEIRIGDSLDNNGNNNPRCAVISNIAPGFTQNFQCNGMDGRYINIVIPARVEYLVLCEVEVYASRLD
uniref:Si:ch211-215k15.4 n=1 Tax=Poecilia latipinna TaxID=48699 RepID=A0A3B3TZC0_9TELE